MKMEIDKRDNALVASDLRISGIPYIENENLAEIFYNICNTININPPKLKSIHRLKITQQTRSNPDTTILAKLESPYERNFMLKSVFNCVRNLKQPLKLYMLNMPDLNANSPFFVNENLTPKNHKLFLQALVLKKQKIIASVFTRRGLVNIKLCGSDRLCQVTSITDLNNLQTYSGHTLDNNQNSNISKN